MVCPIPIVSFTVHRPTTTACRVLFCLRASHLVYLMTCNWLLLMCSVSNPAGRALSTTSSLSAAQTPMGVFSAFSLHKIQTMVCAILSDPYKVIFMVD